MAKENTVFVVHGRNIKIKDSMFAFLRTLDLKPLEWEQSVSLTKKPNPSIMETLRTVFNHAQALLVLLTPDEEVRLKAQYRLEDDNPEETDFKGQARPNVLFELGLAMGFKPNNTVIVQFGQLRKFSDIDGIHILRMNNTSQARANLRERLKNAGCIIEDAVRMLQVAPLCRT